MSTTPTGSQHGDGDQETQPTTPRQPPRRQLSEAPAGQGPSAEERRDPAVLETDRPRSSAPPEAAPAVMQQQHDDRAASEPVKLDAFLSQQQANGRDTPSTTSQLPDFDWEDFEARYERALQDADDHELEILKEAESLSRYFRAWASAASVQDNERAVKRLQTRQRFVNISEEKTAQKQQHYEEVVKAFESAMALLGSRV